jgi:hypothetical protein
VVRVLLHVLARRELEAIDGPPPAGGVSGKPRFADFLCLVANVPSLATSPDRYKGDMYAHAPSFHTTAHALGHTHTHSTNLS